MSVVGDGNIFIELSRAHEHSRRVGGGMPGTTVGVFTARKSKAERGCSVTHPFSELDAPSACLWACLPNKATLCHLSSVVIDCGGAAAALKRYGIRSEPGMVATELFE